MNRVPKRKSRSQADHVLITKLHIPPMRREFVLRPRLSARLDDGAHQKLTLISAPADGFQVRTLACAVERAARLLDNSHDLDRQTEQKRR